MISSIHFFKRPFLFGLFASLSLGMVACDDDDSNPSSDTSDAEELFFISVDGESAEYILTTDDLAEGDISLSGNGTELELSGYSWIFNDDPSVAIGLIYQQGDPGIGLGYELGDDGLSSIGSFQISSRFTSYGFFEDYALTSVGGQTPVDSEGNALLNDDDSERTDAVTFNIIDVAGSLSLTTETIETLNLTGTGEQATFSGIVDMGNGEFLTGVVMSQAQDESATGGASTGTVNSPDSCWVAAMDEDLNVLRLYKSDKISYASGRYRSQYYSQIGKDGDGNVYVFSGSFESTSTNPCGALRINSDETDFDDSYYFNIEELTDGYHFRRVWHITEDYFLLEFYNDIEFTTNTGATQYGIVKMEDKTFSWLGSDFPSSDAISSTGTPMAYDGKMYFPVTVDGSYPVIYIIDPTTVTTTAGITVEATDVNAIGVLTK